MAAVRRSALPSQAGLPPGKPPFESGNQTSVKRGTPSYAYGTPGNNDQFTSGEGYSFSTYDADGNPKYVTVPNSGTWTFTYDEESRVTQVSRPDGTTLYKYDGDGRRVERTVGTITRRYVYDGSNVIAETNAANALIVFRLADVGFVQNNIQKFYQENALGSALATRSDTGALVSRSEYDAYGSEITIQAGQRSDYRFAGKHGYVTDDDTGMQMLGARYYLPAIGRFLTQDPIGQEGGLNLYAYCGNNPLTRIDPDGKAEVEIRYNTVAGLNAYHAFLIVRDNQTKVGPRAEWYFRGGIEHLIGRNEIKFQSGIYNRNSPDWKEFGDGNRRNTTRVISDNRPASYYISIFNKRGREIDTAHVGYATVSNIFPGAGNSNSLARELLEAAGLRQEYRHPVWVPYWRSQLYERRW